MFLSLSMVETPNARLERTKTPPVTPPPSPFHKTASAPLQLPKPPATQGVDMEGMGPAVPPTPPSTVVDGELVALVPSAPPMEAVEQVDLMELGTDTLWRVTLTSQNAEVAASATQDLLEVRGAVVVAVGRATIFSESSLPTHASKVKMT